MFIIGIAGGTGSGKTTVVRKIMERLPKGEVGIISQDSYYKDSSHVPVEDRQKINFDEPAAFDWNLLLEHLKMLKQGKAIEMPTYSYLTCTRQKETVHMEPHDVVLIEGILVMSDPRLRKMMDIKVLGLIENMSYVRCPNCDEKIMVFGHSHIQETADRYNLPVLARVPLDPRIASASDGGTIEDLEIEEIKPAVDFIESL